MGRLPLRFYFLIYPLATVLIKNLAFGGNSGFVGKKGPHGYDPFLSTKCVPIVSEIFGVKMDIIATISYMRTRLGVLVILHLRLAYLRTTRT